MDEALSVFHELGDQTRLRVLASISRGRKNVSSIVSELGLSQPQVSYHLRRLKDAGLAVEERDGRWVWYQANHEAREPHIREILEYVERWTTGLEGEARPEARERPPVERPPVERPPHHDDMDDFLL